MKYLLPKELGGGEIEAEERFSGCAGARPEYHFANGFALLGPAGQTLERVAPPLPEEPGPGAYLIGEVVAVRPDGDPDPRCWCVPGDVAEMRRDKAWYEWPELVERCGGPDVSIRPLVPKPEPVALPWKGHDGSARLVSVEREDGWWTVIRLNGEHVISLNGRYAREMAAALLAAAGEP